MGKLHRRMVERGKVRRMTKQELLQAAREDFMFIVYNELSDDSDNCRANRIIEAADEYVEEVMRLERELSE